MLYYCIFYKYRLGVRNPKGVSIFIRIIRIILLDFLLEWKINA